MSAGRPETVLAELRPTGFRLMAQHPRLERHTWDRRVDQ